MMYEICYITHKILSDSITDIPGLCHVTSTDSCRNINQFHLAFEVALSNSPDLLILHPPSSEEQTDILRSKLENYPSISCIFATTSWQQLDKWFDNGYNSTVVALYEPLLEAIYQELIPLLAKKLSLNKALIESVMEVIPAYQATMDCHDQRNLLGPLSLANVLKQNASPDLPNVSDYSADINCKEWDHFQDCLKSGLSDTSNRIPLPFNSLRNKPFLKNVRRVLFMDDEHYRGWSAVFSAIVFGNTEAIYLITPVSEEDKQKFNISKRVGSSYQVVEQIESAFDLLESGRWPEGFFVFDTDEDTVPSVKAFLDRHSADQFLFPFDMMILDYRLYAEKGDIEPEHVSGYHLLKWFNECNPSIPVLVASASDKVWTLTNLIRVGAWDCYLKPGATISTATELKDLENFLYSMKYIDNYTNWAIQLNVLGNHCKQLLELNRSVAPVDDPFQTLRMETWNSISSLGSILASLSRHSMNTYSDVSFLYSLARVILASVHDTTISFLKQYDKSDKHMAFRNCFFMAKSYRNMSSHGNNLDYVEAIPMQYNVLLWALALSFPSLAECEIKLPPVNLPTYTVTSSASRVLSMCKSYKRHDNFFKSKADEVLDTSELLLCLAKARACASVKDNLPSNEYDIILNSFLLLENSWFIEMCDRTSSASIYSIFRDLLSFALSRLCVEYSMDTDSQI